jgi:hypothetical protein
MELNLDAGDLPATITINGQTYRKEDPDELFCRDYDKALLLIRRVKAIAKKAGCTEQQAAWAINVFGGELDAYPS